jgi:small-conductance mechanosensitive channel
MRSVRVRLCILALLIAASLGSAARVGAQPAAPAPASKATTPAPAAGSGSPTSSSPSASPGDSEEDEAPGWVTLGGRPLYEIRVGIKSLTAAERAQGVSERIESLAWDERFRPQDIRAVKTEMSVDIVAGKRVLASVWEADAKAHGKTRERLASEVAAAIRSGIETYRQERSARAVLKGGLVSVGAVLALLVLLSLLNRGFGRALASARLQKVQEWSGSLRIAGIRVRSPKAAEAAKAAATLALRWLRNLVALLLVYACLQVVLGALPWTRPFATRVLGYVLDPVVTLATEAWRSLPNLLFLAVLTLVTRYVLKLLRFFFVEVERGVVALPNFYREWAMPTYKIVRVLVIALAVVAAFPYIPGSDSPAFRGIGLFAGVLLSLGSTSAVANVVAGVILTYMRAYAVGDFVRIGDSIGGVVETNLLVTRILTVKNERIAIPNSVVLNSHVTNYSALARGKGLILHTTVTIGYAAPWRQVHELLVAAALATPHIRKDPAPFVLQTALNDFFVTYELNAHTDEPWQMPAIYSALHQNIQDRFNEAGVEIMSPHYAQIRDGNQTTIPAQYLPKDYVPPALRITHTDTPAARPS